MHVVKPPARQWWRRACPVLHNRILEILVTQKTLAGIEDFGDFRLVEGPEPLSGSVNHGFP